MSLIAVPPAPQSPESTAVAADGWFPAVDCNQMRDELRLGDVITHARLVGAIRSGLLAVTGELAEWQADQIALDHASLAAVDPAREIDGQNRLELLFTRAVQLAAAAELVELHRDVAATNEGALRNETTLETAADYRRMMTWAIRDLRGTTRTAVELI